MTGSDPTSSTCACSWVLQVDLSIRRVTEFNEWLLQGQPRDRGPCTQRCLLVTVLVWFKVLQQFRIIIYFYFFLGGGSLVEQGLMPSIYIYIYMGALVGAIEIHLRAKLPPLLKGAAHRLPLCSATVLA